MMIITKIGTRTASATPASEIRLPFGDDDATGAVL